MKLLFDQNLSYRLVRLLAVEFPDSRHVSNLGLSRADDAVVWARAGAEAYVVVSQDADFSEMATVYGPPPRVVWLRCGNRPTQHIEQILRRNAASIRAMEELEIDCIEIF